MGHRRLHPCAATEPACRSRRCPGRSTDNTREDEAMNETIRSKLNNLRRAGLALGLLGLAACGLGVALNAHQFFISYLVGYMFWLGLALGSMGVAMIHHLTGGRWGFVTRRLLEAGFMTLPWMALLFVPIFFGLDNLYPWVR